jgi:hypothetical protein
LEESKEALKGELSNKAVQTYVEGLLKGANIKYFDEAGKEKEFPRTVSAPKADEAEHPAPESKPAEKK